MEMNRRGSTVANTLRAGRGAGGLALALGLVLTLGGGCARRVRTPATAGAGGEEASTPYVGPVTFTNASSHRVCDVELGDAPAWTTPLEPGASATLVLASPTARLAVVECETGRLLVGAAPLADVLPAPLDRAQLALVDTASAAPADATTVVASAGPTLAAAYEELANQLLPGFVAPSPFAPLAPASLEVLIQRGRAHGYRESILTLELGSADWTISQDRRTGVTTNRHMQGLVVTRFPDQHCQLHAVAFVEAAVGAGFSGTLSTPGLGGGVGVPCALATYAATRAGVAHAP